MFSSYVKTFRYPHYYGETLWVYTYYGETLRAMGIRVTLQAGHAIIQTFHVCLSDRLLEVLSGKIQEGS